MQLKVNRTNIKTVERSNNLTVCVGRIEEARRRKIADNSEGRIYRWIRPASRRRRRRHRLRGEKYLRGQACRDTPTEGGIDLAIDRSVGRCLG